MTNPGFEGVNSEIPLPPVEYLIAEEPLPESDAVEIQTETGDHGAVLDEDAASSAELSEEALEPVDASVVETPVSTLPPEEPSSEEPDAPQKHPSPAMQELHDAFFKEEAVETDPEVDLRAIQEAVETQLELEEAIAAAEHGEIELPSDALQPLTLAPAEEKPEEPPAAAVVAPAPEEAGTAGPSLHFEQVEQADGPISSRVVHDPAASNPTVAPANRATKNEAPARTFYDQDGKPVPFIAPEHKDAPAAWREPFNWQVFCAGMVDALLVLMCVAPVTIIAAAGGQDLMAQAEEGLSAAVPWNVVLAFWGSAFFFHVFLTFASVSWTGATVGGNLFKIFILSRESATRPQPLQTGVLALFSGVGLLAFMGGPFFALWLNRRFRGPGHLMASTVPVIANADEP